MPLDHPLVTLDFVSRANLNRLDTYPTTAVGVKQIAYSPDASTNGVYLRLREHSDQTSRLSRLWGGSGALRIEPFAGFFDQTSIYHYDGFFQTKEKDPSDANKPRYTFEELDRKPNDFVRRRGSGAGRYGDRQIRDRQETTV